MLLKKVIMKTFMLICAVMTIAGAQVFAQKYFTRDGKISFYSDAPLEKIEANNSKVSSVIDTENGDMEFAVLIKSFYFEKALMQEHFNENYLESNIYPKATFKGSILNIDEIDFATDGTYSAKVAGDLTIHGVTNPLETTGEIIVKGGIIHASSKFDVTVADYKIEIPKVVRDNIAKVVEVSVDIAYKPLRS